MANVTKNIQHKWPNNDEVYVPPLYRVWRHIHVHKRACYPRVIFSYLRHAFRGLVHSSEDGNGAKCGVSRRAGPAGGDSARTSRCTLSTIQLVLSLYQSVHSSEVRYYRSEDQKLHRTRKHKITLTYFLMMAVRKKCFIPIENLGRTSLKTKIIKRDTGVLLIRHFLFISQTMYWKA